MCLYFAACVVTAFMVLISFMLNPILGAVALIVGVAVCWEMAKEI